MSEILVINQVMSMLTSGSFGAIITITIIVVTAIAITRQWEKAQLLLFPLTFGFIGIGLGATNQLISFIWVPLVILLFIGNILYENRLLGGRLTSQIIKASKRIANLDFMLTKKDKQRIKSKASKIDWGEKKKNRLEREWENILKKSKEQNKKIKETKSKGKWSTKETENKRLKKLELGQHWTRPDTLIENLSSANNLFKKKPTRWKISPTEAKIKRIRGLEETAKKKANQRLNNISYFAKRGLWDFLSKDDIEFWKKRKKRK